MSLLLPTPHSSLVNSHLVSFTQAALSVYREHFMAVVTMPQPPTSPGGRVGVFFGGSVVGGSVGGSVGQAGLLL